jgi:hypothetical protein
MVNIGFLQEQSLVRNSTDSGGPVLVIQKYRFGNRHTFY